MKQLTEEQKAIAFNRMKLQQIQFTGRSMGKERLFSPLRKKATHIARYVNGKIIIEKL